MGERSQQLQATPSTRVRPHHHRQQGDKRATAHFSVLAIVKLGELSTQSQLEEIQQYQHPRLATMNERKEPARSKAHSRMYAPTHTLGSSSSAIIRVGRTRYALVEHEGLLVSARSGSGDPTKADAREADKTKKQSSGAAAQQGNM